ncbi:Calmodulin and related proteins (EF-Hand superfamily) [Handroanthus impetiginosus]|uniref:Calmodulin and related proteins (EF-Hand superfamily) n=1 Tax=Handroanthus impetiginosus TaxID=429701 RepID=A0A2G9GHT0_9LAMI|nr:Calmodulin and related proteins (EF-Hand superfamily) [Handroanthus impetiginosus]
MSLSNQNAFPLYEIPLNTNTVHLTFLSVIFFQFLLLCKRISEFFLGFQSQLICSENHSDSIKNRDFEKSTKKEKKIVLSDKKVGKGEVEIVLKSLGMFSNDEENNFPAKLDEDDIFNVFEERNASLDEVKDAFDVFDDNRDGFIDEKELQRVLCALGFEEGLELEKCRRMIGVFDENGDGKIDFDEFVKFMENSFS